MAPTSAGTDRLDRGLVWLCAVLVLGAVTTLLDSTIVNVAVGTIARQFDTSLATIQWTVTGYLLALSVVIPMSGWAMERFGAKRMWLISQVLFLVGSVLAGLAWSVGSLIVFRVLQGLGGGLIMPLAQAILAGAAGPARMGRVMAIVSVPAMLAPVVGPVLGGLLIDDASWRWIFFVNVPIGIAALVLAWIRLPADESGTQFRLDLRGLVLLSPGLVALLYGLSEATSTGHVLSARALAGVLVGVVLLGAFAWHSLTTKVTPLIDLRLLRDRSFTASVVAQFLVNAALFGAMILIPLYFQAVRCDSVLLAGLLMAPQGIGYIVVMPVIGKLTDRIGAGRVAPVGVVVAAVATVPFLLLGSHTSVWLLAVAMLVRGIGFATASLPTMAAAYHSLDRASVPRATSAVNIAQRVGASIGVAVITVALQLAISSHASGSVPDTAVAAPLAPGLALAFGQSFWWSAGFILAALVPMGFLPRTPAGRPAGAPTAQAELASDRA